MLTDAGAEERAAIARFVGVTEPSRVVDELSVIWRALKVGALYVRAWRTTHWMTHLEVQARERPDDLSARACEEGAILERLLLGEPGKAVAMQLGCAMSTLHGKARRRLIEIGIRGPIKAVPAALVALVHTVNQRVSAPEKKTAIIHDYGQRVSLISFAHPAEALGLSPPELAIVGWALEGLTTREIAQQRGAAPRTIAQQKARLYRKLGVSGRLELLCHLFSV